MDTSKHFLLAKCTEVMQAIKKCGASKEITDAVNEANELLKLINLHVVVHGNNLHSQHVMLALGVNYDEPIFVLKGRDPQAPNLTYNWAYDRECMSVNSQKTFNARKIAHQMRDYKLKNPNIGYSLVEYNDVFMIGVPELNKKRRDTIFAPISQRDIEDTAVHNCFISK